jgi:K+-transporting ATPase KdpF subunit
LHPPLNVDGVGNPDTQEPLGHGPDRARPDRTGNRVEITHPYTRRYPQEVDWENLLALCCSILLAGYLVYALVHPERF